MKKNYRLYLIKLLSLTFFFFFSKNLLAKTFFEHIDSVTNQGKHFLEVGAGIYVISGDSNVSDIGAFDVHYTFKFHEKYSAQISQSFIYGTESFFQNLLRGNDFLVQYCIDNCFVEETTNGPVKASQFNKLGYSIGTGVSFRDAQLSSQNISYSGILVNGSLFWHIRPRYSGVLRANVSQLSKSSKSVTLVVITAGLRMSF